MRLVFFLVFMSTSLSAFCQEKDSVVSFFGIQFGDEPETVIQTLLLENLAKGYNLHLESEKNRCGKAITADLYFFSFLHRPYMGLEKPSVIFEFDSDRLFKMDLEFDLQSMTNEADSVSSYDHLLNSVTERYGSFVSQKKGDLSQENGPLTVWMLPFETITLETGLDKKVRLNYEVRDCSTRWSDSRGKR